MSSKRRRFSGELKAKVALEALRDERTLQEIASQYQVHPNQVGAWKRQAVEGLAEVFSKGAERRTRDHESEEEAGTDPPAGWLRLAETPSTHRRPSAAHATAGLSLLPARGLTCSRRLVQLEC